MKNVTELQLILRLCLWICSPESMAITRVVSTASLCIGQVTTSFIEDHVKAVASPETTNILLCL